MRWLAVVASGLLVAAGGVLAGAGPAGAGTQVLYAAVTPAGAQDCSDPADACDLSTALADVSAGGVIELVTPGATAHYVGNWTVSTSGTSATAPVTIEPAPGVSDPALDGNGGSSTGCSTGSCGGSVLSVGAGEYLTLADLTITNAGDSGLSNQGTATVTDCTFTDDSADGGGAIDNSNRSSTGTLTVTNSVFSDNSAGDEGGAIDSGFDGAGTVTVTDSAFTGNVAYDEGGAIAASSIGGGTVSVTGSTFTDNSTSNHYYGYGGAIANAAEGNGTVSVTGSTFTGNNAPYGGAINNGWFGGGSVTVTASTFSGNTAYDGGAIDSGDDSGGGSVTVTASTLSGNTASDGGAIDGGDDGGGGSVLVAGDVFDTSCDQAGGSWTDGGYNAGADSSCFSATPATGDVSAGSLGLGFLAGNGGPTQTILPQAASPVTGIIPDPATVTLGGGQVTLCPATDQRGYTSAPDTSCDAGAVQTSGITPSLALADSAAPGGFRQAGDTISYLYQVTNTGAGPLSGITVKDPAVPQVSCPAAQLAAGASETCTGSYTVTTANVTAGQVTDHATAAGTTPAAAAIASNSATVTVHEAWPAAASGAYRPAAGAAEGYYLSVTGNRWTVLVTHPGTAKISFTGRVTVPAYALSDLVLAGPAADQQDSLTTRAVTFRITSYGKVSGFSFTTSAKVNSITFTLNISGQPATAAQIYQGSTPTQASQPSPLTYTRK